MGRRDIMDPWFVFFRLSRALYFTRRAFAFRLEGGSPLIFQFLDPGNFCGIGALRTLYYCTASRR